MTPRMSISAARMFPRRCNVTTTDPTSWTLPVAFPSDLPAAAATYAAAGVPVFPCVPGGKRPLTEHGFHDATTDPGQITAWWSRYPAANIGIPTGHVVDVLDVDVHATGTGYPTLRTLHQEGLIAGWGQAVRSPSGGLHLYYPADPLQAGESWSRGRAHIDFRGTGGYIIASPSMITTEKRIRRYEVIALGRAPRPVDAQAIRDLLTPAPAIRTAITGVDSRDVSIERLTGWVASLPEGNRNTGLFWAACRLAEAGLTEHDALNLLEPAAASAGLQMREIAATIGSALRSTQLTHDPGDTTSGPPTRTSVSR